MNTQSPAYNFIALCLRIALIVSLGATVWSIYRRLPGDDPATALHGAQTKNPTTLLVALRPPPDEMGAPLDIPVTVAFGSRDRILPRRQWRRTDMLPRDSIVAQLPRCGHFPMADDPAAVTRLVARSAARA